MPQAWKCVKIGSAACRQIIHIAPWMLAAYMAAHPLPTGCRRHDCHWVIPKREFVPGGMFGNARANDPAAPNWQPSAAAFSLAPLSFPNLRSPPASASRSPAPSGRRGAGSGGRHIRALALAAPQPVPEPPSGALLAIGALVALALSWGKQRG